MLAQMSSCSPCHNKASVLLSYAVLCYDAGMLSGGAALEYVVTYVIAQRFGLLSTSEAQLLAQLLPFLETWPLAHEISAKFTKEDGLMKAVPGSPCPTERVVDPKQSRGSCHMLSHSSTSLVLSSLLSGIQDTRPHTPGGRLTLWGLYRHLSNQTLRTLE